MSKTYAKNRKAYHDYEILEKFEAGIVLYGDEVKSIKNSQTNLKGSYIEIIEEEAFAKGIHVSKYKFSNNKNFDPVRLKKLLLNKKEITKIEQSLNEKGVTLVPLSFYEKNGLIKLEFGICRGKKLFDKRKDLKRKDQEIDIKRALKNFN